MPPNNEEGSVRSLTFSCLALVAFVALSGQAFSATVTVGSCTSPVKFATIQQAVNASPAGTVIQVCPGNYPEQVVIAKNLTLEGIEYETEDAVVILPPAGGLVANVTDVVSGSPVAAQLVVQNAGPVSISNLTVDGTGNGLSCGPDVRGILFQNSSGKVNHVAVRNQVPNGIPNGCQVGQSIWVETAAGHSSIVTVEHSSVHNYNKNGITGNDAGTTLTLTGNYVQGAGVVPGGAAQNGIQVGFGATGTIKDNIVIDNIYVDPTVAASADVLLFDAAENSNITISRNIVGNSQLPIALYTDTVGVGDGVSVTGNRVFGASTYDGIDVCTNGNTVTGNTIVNSAESGVHLDAACGSTGHNNTVTGNVILESACAGILDDTNGADNTITSDIYFTVPFTLTSSTSKCTVAAGPATLAKAKAMPKVSPAR
jgi:parallel beta-helix repeat protein